MHSFIIKNILTEAEENYLISRFSDCMKFFKVPEQDIEELYDRLYFEYSAWSRLYHNLSHVYSLLRLSEQYRSKLNNPFVVDLAIWFHDIVYDASNKDNELQSAILFEDLMRPFIEKEVVEMVRSLILSTYGHKPLIPDGNDHQFFLDFDLSILASDQETYRIYSDAIREEYKSLFSFLVYNGGRKKVLHAFLDRKMLYFSEHFRSNCEAMARQNLKWEILYLG